MLGPPAPDRQQREVEPVRELLHAVEEVGVAGEVDRGDSPASTNPIASDVPRRSRRLPGCSASHGGDRRPRRPGSDSPGASSDTARKPRRSRNPPAPRGTSSGTSRPIAPQRGEVGVVVVQVGDQHGVERPRSRRAPAAAPWRRSGPTRDAQHRVGEQADAVELDEDGRVADVGDPRRTSSRRGRTGRGVGCAAYRPASRDGGASSDRDRARRAERALRRSEVDARPRLLRLAPRRRRRGAGRRDLAPVADGDDRVAGDRGGNHRLGRVAPRRLAAPARDPAGNRSRPRLPRDHRSRRSPSG